MQSDLLSSKQKPSKLRIPLAETLRPKILDDVAGHTELVGEEGFLRKLIQKDKIPSMVFWGPPGVGKTTIARIISTETNSIFKQISAVDSGKKDLRTIVLGAKESQQAINKHTILFIDEIHRFNKAQQDYLLPFVEDGTLTLIGATTENPSFEVNSALISRMRVVVLKQLNHSELVEILTRGIQHLKNNGRVIKIDTKIKEKFTKMANGDPRKLINALELAADYSDGKNIKIDSKLLSTIFQKSIVYYDKSGEEHYNIISALHKSMRSSDENASLYWLARMIEGGEDPIYIARRMLRFAAEDIGNADPMATVLGDACFDACKKIGLPECNVHLAQLALYLANAPKDNAAYIGITKAQEDARNTMNLQVPMHLRNAPTDLMKNIGYGKGYVYDHDVEENLPAQAGKSGQQCLPDELKGKIYI